MKGYGLIGLIVFSLIGYPALYAATACRCTPNDTTCWPDTATWNAFAKQLTGQLIQPKADIAACTNTTGTVVDDAACKQATQALHNPFHMENNAGDTQSQGWLNAWNGAVSPYAVAVANTEDVVKTVNFARDHHLRLVIKGTGHDYLGRSNAPNSLLLWTHNMRTVNYQNAFVPTGCSAHTKAVPALTVEAGTRWLEAFGVATTQHHRYVQGGGCTSVGAAGGFPQGNGFGPFSKKFGTGAMGILQAEIVTANGKVLIANACQNKDLFWALRGGGAGTFGVVTKLTLAIHPLPRTFGILQGTITATNDAAFKAFIPMIIKLYRDHLNNEHWGEKIIFTPHNTVQLVLLFQGLTQAQVTQTIQPLEAYLNKHKNLYHFDDKKIIIMPAYNLWNYPFLKQTHPELITPNPESPQNQYWWTGDTAETSYYWYTYQSWWIPVNLFSAAHADQLANAIYQSSRLTKIAFHINKGLAGAPKAVIQMGLKTALHPAALNAAALVVIGAGTNQILNDQTKQANSQKAQQAVDNVNRAMAYFTQLAPQSGSYANESDYFIAHWQQAFWGKHYEPLLAIKNKYDPEGLFYCHHCVGSEQWSDDGMCHQLARTNT